MPGGLLGTSGGLLGAPDGVFLRVYCAFLILAVLECLGSLPAQIHHALRLGRFGFDASDLLKLSEELLHLGPLIVLIRREKPFPAPLCGRRSGSGSGTRSATDSTNASMPSRPRLQVT
jgi:hypothetical protein